MEGGGGGRGKAWLARGPTYAQISTGELAAAYTRPLGYDLNSKFFFYKSCEFNEESKSKRNMKIGLNVMEAHY